MKFFKSAPEEATVTIPIKIVDGKITYFYEGPMPTLQEGAIGELTLPQYAVLDKDWIAPLREEKKVCLLEPETILMLAMRIQRVQFEFHDEVETFKDLDFGRHIGAANYRFVPVVLTKPLNLILRGTKRAILSGGQCRLPKMKLTATSLNQAYTFASTKYEPERQSHTGNVFQHVFYSGKQEGKWWPLETLRGQHEAQYEAEKLLSQKQLAEMRVREAEYEKRKAKQEMSLELFERP